MDKFAEGLKSLMKKEDDDEERSEGFIRIYEFFTKIKDYFEKIFVITHNPLVTNWADCVLKIRKSFPYPLYSSINSSA